MHFSRAAQSENLVMTSYEISKLIAKIVYLHTVGEKLICNNMLQNMLASRVCDLKKTGEPIKNGGAIKQHSEAQNRGDCR